MIFLSFFALVTALGLALMGEYILLLNKKEKLNILALLVYACFAEWSLCYAFLYIAPTAGEAMMWHRIGAFGWVLFCPIATQFFFLLSDASAKRKKKRPYFLLYILPIAILINALFNPEGTSVASGFARVSGVGWTYISNQKSIWYWLYLLNIVTYFTFALTKMYSWAINSRRRRFIKQAKAIVLLNPFVLSLGICWDLIFPVFSSKIPPGCNFVAFIWGISFLYIIKSLKLMTIEDAATPDIILKTVMDPILVLDKRGIIIKCNQATADMLKWNIEQIVNRPLSDFFRSGTYDRIKSEELFSGKQLRSMEIDFLDSAGEIIHTTASFSLAENKLDGPVGIVASLHDVTVLKKIQNELNERNGKNLELSRQLEILANYDALTGLLNRRFFIERVDLMIAEYNYSGKGFALMFIDLDGFKKVNDDYGHDIGDKLLQHVAELFLAAIRKADFVTRFGGDEFVVFLDQFVELEIDHFAQRLKNSFADPIVIDGCKCSVDVSFGISEFPKDGSSSLELIKIADSRMYSNKKVKKTK